MMASVASFVVLLSCSALLVPASTKPTTTVLQNIPRLVNANNILSFNLYKSLASDKSNIFFSPLSISSALGMLYLGARSKTSQEMEVALGYKESDVDIDNLHPTFKELFSFLATPKDEYTLSVANALMGKQNSGILSSYKEDLDRFYSAVYKEIDFNEADKAVQEINSWVNGITRGKIEKFLDEPPSPDTLLVLLNAVYFKGNWETPFNPELTFPRPFFQNGESGTMKSIPMMYNDSAVLPYVDIKHVGVKAVQLPYEGNDISMIVVLPDKLDGIKELEERLTPKDLNSIIYGLRETEITLGLPKFKLEYSHELKESLRALGMTSAFDSTADLSGIHSSADLFVSKVFHKAVIEVNEEGSEAAAVTEIELENKMGSSKPEFMANHPFMFFILDMHTKMVIFTGRVNEL